jgi:hypothetical protein
VFLVFSISIHNIHVQVLIVSILAVTTHGIIFSQYGHIFGSTDLYSIVLTCYGKD